MALNRTIGSTLAGQAVDTVIFIPLAYIGTPTFAPILIFNQWVTKVGIEVVFTPVTYALVAWLKRKEGLDTYDYKTRYNPFYLAEKGQ